MNTLGSFYCVNHTVLCAEGFILNAHRKCVGKPEPRPPPRPALLLAARHARSHMLKGPAFACELAVRPPRSVCCLASPLTPWEAALPRDGPESELEPGVTGRLPEERASRRVGSRTGCVGSGAGRPGFRAGPPGISGVSSFLSSLCFIICEKGVLRALLPLW